MLRLIKITVLITGLSLLLWSCEDSNDNSSIPDYPVYLERNVNLEAIELRTIGGYKTYPTAEKLGDAVGFGGILIFYGYEDAYYAYDLCCPYEKKQTIRVKPNDVGQCTCPSCGSVYNIGYGNGNCLSGPAKEGLKIYTVRKYNSSAGLIIQVTR